MAQSNAFKRKFSGVADGLGLEIAATSTPGDLLHTAVAGTTAGTYDEVWLWAQNNHTVEVVLTIEFGSHDHAANIILTLQPKSGLIPVIPGLILQNSLDINVFASVTAVVTVFGFVNAITD